MPSRESILITWQHISSPTFWLNESNSNPLTNKKSCKTNCGTPAVTLNAGAGGYPILYSDASCSVSWELAFASHSVTCQLIRQPLIRINWWLVWCIASDIRTNQTKTDFSGRTRHERPNFVKDGCVYLRGPWERVLIVVLQGLKGLQCEPHHLHIIIIGDPQLSRLLLAKALMAYNIFICNFFYHTY